MDLKDKIKARNPVEDRKNVVILRAVSSAGKSAFADYIQALDPNTVVCCADDYFTDSDGNYNFDINQIKQAHFECFDKFQCAIERFESNVVVANTNTSEWEFSKYKDYAETNGYTVFVVVIEKRHDNMNDHNLPSGVMDRQEQSIRKSLKLR